MMFLVGDRVRISKKCKSYRSVCRNKCGTVAVQQWPNGRVGIKIDGLENKRSKYGAFWILQQDIISESEWMDAQIYNERSVS